MDSGDVEVYLEALDRELATRPIQKPVRFVLLGGVYMMFFFQNRNSTKDVDIIPLGFPDTTEPNQETKVFRSAVNAVAKQFQIRRDWLNDVVAAFVPELGSISLWREYPNLHIYVPEAEYILALKLLAGREKDEEDILILCQRLAIHTREQAQALVDRFAEKSWQEECVLEQTLSALF